MKAAADGALHPRFMPGVRWIEMIYDFGLVIMAACAVAYYCIGRIEYDRGFLLGAISVLLWIITAYVLRC